MKPGARAIFAENSGRNQLLMLARRRVAGRFGVPRYSTADEHPLSREDVAALETAFTVRLHYPVFEFWRIFDRQVLRFRSPRLSKLCAALDHLCQRSPLLRRYSYRVVVELRPR